jgi:hypothetical protein
MEAYRHMCGKVRVSFLWPCLATIGLGVLFTLPLNAESGLDFPGSAGVQTTMRFRFTNPLPIYPATYIWRAYPRQQPSYYTTFFWGNDNGCGCISDFAWDGGVPNSFYGAHPYPDPAPNGPAHKWEIATDEGTDWLSAEDVVYDRWYTQALVAWADSQGYKHTTFYWDLPDTTKVVDYSTQFGSGAGYGNKNPPFPALTFGDAPWNPGNEVYDGVLRGIRVYATNLSLADIQSEANAPLSTAAGAAKVWYMNMDPTPTDISDKSGKGHQPAWVGSERPKLYTNSATTSCDFNGDGLINSADLQNLANAVLSGSSAKTYDLNNDGKIDAVDAQFMVNVILNVRTCP